MKLLVALALAAALPLAACSSDSDDSGASTEETAAETSTQVLADWEEPQDVLDALNDAGYVCEWTGFGDQILDESPVTGEPAEVIIIRCDGYGVALGSGEDGWYSQLLPECQPLTEQDRSSPLATAPIVLGTNFAILGSDEEGGFPERTPIEGFVEAFGGETITFLDLYDRVCGSE